MTALTVRAGRREIGKIARASREKTRIPFPCNNIFHGDSAQINRCLFCFRGAGVLAVLPVSRCAKGLKGRYFCSDAGLFVSFTASRCVTDTNNPYCPCDASYFVDFTAPLWIWFK